MQKFILSFLILLISNYVFASSKNSSSNGYLLKDANFSIYEGTVTKINPKTRELSLKSVDGEVVYKAPHEMKNFPQVQIGDEIKVTFEVSVHVEKLPNGSQIRTKTLDTSNTSAPVGAKPAQTMTRKTSIEAPVIGKNEVEKYVVIKNLNDEEEKIHINQMSFLKHIKVGDALKISYFDKMKSIVSSKN